MELITEKTQKDYPVEVVGGKGRGLIKLKGIEKDLYFYEKEVIIPDFFIIPTGYDLKNPKNLQDILRHSEKLGGNQFAIRSSSPFEDEKEHSFDGIFRTELNVSNQNSSLELIKSIKRVKESALNEKAMRYSKDFGLNIENSMAVIVQIMVDGYQKGIIYSKFPASIEVTKIISKEKDEEKERITLVRRILNEDQKPYTLGDKIIEDGYSLEDPLAHDLTELSYDIERFFNFQVRIEYQIEREDNKEKLYLLQARSIAGIKNIKNITLPELTDGELLCGSYDINGQGDYTLPAVVIICEDKDRNIDNLPYKKVKELDHQFKDGYILICDYLEQHFYGINYDKDTPHKKACVAGGSIGRQHDLDIARQKGLLYLGLDHFGLVVNKGIINVKTGDLVRIVSDGVKGLLYKVKKF